MTKELVEELIKAVKEDNLYDFIANNYTRFSQYELARIAMELDFTCNKRPTDAIREDLVAGLLDYLWPEDDE